MSKLSYSLDDYINNPAGRGSAVNSTVSINLDKFTQDLGILESKNGRIKYSIVKGSQINKQVYYIHFLIPSNTQGFANDVVFELLADSNDSNSTRTIKNYKVKFFANDANFVYTYAYTFNKHGVLIKELIRKLPYRSITQKPSTRNPDNAMGYSRNIIFAYLVMRRDNLFDKENISRISKPGSINNITLNIDSFDKKEQQRKKIENDLKMAKFKGKNNIDSTPEKSKGLLGSRTSTAVKISKVVGKVKTTSMIKSSKKSKHR